MKKIFLIMACTVVFSGCVVRPPSLEVPSVSIEPPIKVITPDSRDYDGGHRPGKGCPPGLAKQGRC